MYDKIKVSILFFPQNRCSAYLFCKQFFSRKFKANNFFTGLLCANNFFNSFGYPLPPPPPPVKNNGLSLNKNSISLVDDINLLHPSNILMWIGSFTLLTEFVLCSLSVYYEVVL